jgi:hypothetical protein
MADLSGNWLGTYWQDEMPSRFEASFVQSGNIFTGSILDDNYLGEASVSGEVIGRSLSICKPRAKTLKALSSIKIYLSFSNAALVLLQSIFDY